MRSTKWGIDGVLSINEEHVCDTVENPLNHLPQGTYRLAFLTPQRWDYRAIGIYPLGEGESGSSSAMSQSLGFILRGNGPFACGGICGVTSPECNIAVGNRYLEGVVVNSANCLRKLLKRMEKVILRGGEVTLRVVN